MCYYDVSVSFFLAHPVYTTEYSGLPSDRWHDCLGLYLYGLVPCCMRVFHSGSSPVLFVPGITVFHICCSWRGGGGFWPMVGRGAPFSILVIFPGGLPEWGHLSKLGLGSGCSGP